jgi:Ferredoxin-dependent bilin reductase
MNLQEYFSQLDAQIASLQSALHLKPVSVPESYRLLHGTLAGTQVQMLTHAFASEAYVRWVYVAMRESDTKESRNELAKPITRTLVGLSRANAPIVGMDVVAMKGRVSLFALDLAPAGGACAWRAPLLVASKAHLTAWKDRPLPAFAHETFSPEAIIGAASEGEEQALLDCTAQLFNGLAHSVNSSTGTADPDRINAWLASERKNRKERSALSRIFGEDTALGYFDEFLFRNL